MPVLGERGLLGYLWASDAENAASFEPRDVDETYRVGLRALDRLRAAHDEGLTPSDALRQLSGFPEAGGATPRRTRLDALRVL